MMKHKNIKILINSYKHMFPNVFIIFLFVWSNNPVDVVNSLALSPYYLYKKIFQTNKNQLKIVLQIILL